MHPVELCQMSVAFGLVYLGLKVARYRIRTCQAIVSGTKGLVAATDTNSVFYASLLRTDSAFADRHHMIADFISMLPQKYLDRIPESMTELAKGRKTSGIMWLFAIYNSNWDTRIVFAVSVLLPMAIMTDLHFALSLLNATHTNFLIYFAMLPPVFFVLLGISMYTVMEKSILEAVEYITAAHGEAAINKDIS